MRGAAVRGAAVRGASVRDAVMRDAIPAACEIAVVGAGPAGATIAALLAKRGREVVVLERDAMPRDKLCGEFLSYESHPILAESGAWDAIRERGAPIDRALVVARSGAEVRTTLEHEALGISRLALDVALRDAARARGALYVERAEVRAVDQDRGGVTLAVRRGGAESTLRARLVVGAWGRRARLDRSLERPFVSARHPWVGMKRHHLIEDARTREELERAVELHAFDGGYCGINLVDGGIANVCALIERRALDAAPRPGLGGARALDAHEPEPRSAARRAHSAPGARDVRGR